MEFSGLDESILKAASGGDAAAFEKLILSVEKLIYNIALRMLGNPADAEDAAQEAVLRIYRNLRKCVSLNHFRNWACVITNNICLDEIRRRKGRGALSLDELSGDGARGEPPYSADDPTPPEALLAAETRETILAALRGLPPKLKSAVILRDIEGFSYADMSRILGVSEGTVKSRINRARSAMRKLLSA
ncbi:MAG: RNA polymerase sigma factor [Clostridiales bacterium]|jgi:RNA polymerase sigma-70 factor (ECF subfamily)|nr:RNA polymerase sigma factor [Clostridiales bacterium]